MSYVFFCFVFCEAQQREILFFLYTNKTHEILSILLAAVVQDIRNVLTAVGNSLRTAIIPVAGKEVIEDIFFYRWQRIRLFFKGSRVRFSLGNTSRIQAEHNQNTIMASAEHHQESTNRMSADYEQDFGRTPQEKMINTCLVLLVVELNTDRKQSTIRTLPKYNNSRTPPGIGHSTSRTPTEDHNGISFKKTPRSHEHNTSRATVEHYQDPIGAPAEHQQNLGRAPIELQQSTNRTQTECQQDTSRTPGGAPAHQQQNPMEHQQDSQLSTKRTTTEH